MYQVSDAETIREHHRALLVEAEESRLAQQLKMTRTNTQGRSWGRILVASFLLAAFIGVSLMLAAKPAHAQTTFTVNSTGDPGTGGCNSTECTLREAIGVTNRVSGADTIRFDIPEASSKRIGLDSELPAITDAVTIDGYTQPGASENTLQRGATNAVLQVSLDGFNTDNADGLEILADDVVVRGLAIGNFDRNGISIGAINPSDGLIEPTSVEIGGNFIGTDASGTVGRPNGFNGINSATDGEGNIIGGATPEARNLITNNSVGVNISGSEGGYVISGNLIGTDKSGTAGGLGNRNEGVGLSAPNNTVGGVSPGAANTIASNGSQGVEVASNVATSNRILSNSVFSNGALGIDLVGGTENDPGDADTGPNDLQNKPVLTSATTTGSTTTVKGRLNSTSNDSFVIQFFSNPLGNEGKKFLGSKRVSTESNGNVTFTFVPSEPVAAGQKVTATAREVVEANTSELSSARSVLAR